MGLFSFLTGLAAANVVPPQESRFRPLPEEDAPSVPQPAAPMPERRAPDGELPFAQGHRFATLDAYLDHRRRLGAIDLPWYERVAPDVYELRTTMRPAPPARRFTREQLSRAFGLPG